MVKELEYGIFLSIPIGEVPKVAASSGTSNEERRLNKVGGNKELPLDISYNICHMERDEKGA